jgi:hypothetical protein
MIKGQEVQMGFVPAQIYKVLCHKVEVAQSSKGFKMAKLNLEIIGPEIAEAAGVQYKTLGTLGTAYAMLENKKGVDAALNMLSPSLKALGLYDSLPNDYGQSDVEQALHALSGAKFNMLVQSQTEYAVDNAEDRFTAAKAKRDEDGELIVKRYTPQFDFGQVRGGFEPAAF